MKSKMKKTMFAVMMCLTAITTFGQTTKQGAMKKHSKHCTCYVSHRHHVVKTTHLVETPISVVPQPVTVVTNPQVTIVRDTPNVYNSYTTTNTYVMVTPVVRRDSFNMHVGLQIDGTYGSGNFGNHAVNGDIKLIVPLSRHLYFDAGFGTTYMENDLANGTETGRTLLMVPIGIGVRVGYHQRVFMGLDVLPTYYLNNDPGRNWGIGFGPEAGVTVLSERKFSLGIFGKVQYLQSNVDNTVNWPNHLYSGAGIVARFE